MQLNRERLAVGLAAAAMLGYYGYASAERYSRRGQRVVMPREGGVLHLVNMNSSEAAALSSVFSSWSSSLTPTLAHTMSYEVDQTTLLTTVQAEAMAAFDALGSTGPCVAMRIGVTFGTDKDALEEDATWPAPLSDIKRMAKTYGGAPMTVTAYLAYADRPKYCEVFQHKVSGTACKEALVDESFTTLEDLFMLNTACADLFPRLSNLYPIEKAMAASEWAAGDRVSAAVAAKHLAKSADLARGMEGGAVLLRPHRWRAYLDLAYAVMYRWQEAVIAGEVNAKTSFLSSAAQALKGVGQLFKSSLRLTEAQRRDHAKLLMQYDAKDPLCGRFENHITVNFDASPDAEAESKRFMDVAAAIGIKVVSIALPKGATFPAQVMTSYYTSGRVKECTLALLEMGLYLTLSGFKCARVKMELQLSEDLTSAFFMRAAVSNDDACLVGLCPIQDEPATDPRNMSAVQYFEFHVKLGIPEAQVTAATPIVKAVGQKHNAHLSKNAFKVYSSTGEAASSDGGVSAERLLLYFLTLRVYGTGFSTCVKRMHALRQDAEAALAPLGGRVTTVQREYSVFDSNTGLDAGWFDRSAATPSFMLADEGSA